MAILRRKSNDQPVPSDESVETVDEPVDPRADGPFDDAERSTEDEAGYVDLGSLKVRGRVGFEIRLQSDGDGDDVGAAVLVAEDSALELRGFASSRSGGLWEDVRADLVAEVERLDGTYEVVDGHYGPELHLRIPVTLDDGAEGFQPSRIVVVEGPRWMLRGTFLGRAALEPDDEGLLFAAFREVVVVRGTEAMAPRDPLLLTVPTEALVVDPDAAPPEE